MCMYSFGTVRNIILANEDCLFETVVIHQTCTASLGLGRTDLAESCGRLDDSDVDPCPPPTTPGPPIVRASDLRPR